MPHLRGPKLPNVAEILENDINLAHNTNLRSIELNCDEIFLYPPRFLVALVYQVISPHLTHITMHFTLYGIADLDTVDWLQIQSLFTQKQRPNLRRLQIFLTVQPEIRSAAARSIRDRLPVLEARGVLEIDYE